MVAKDEIKLHPQILTVKPIVSDPEINLVTDVLKNGIERLVVLVRRLPTVNRDIILYALQGREWDRRPTTLKTNLTDALRAMSTLAPLPVEKVTQRQR